MCYLYFLLLQNIYPFLVIYIVLLVLIFLLCNTMLYVFVSSFRFSQNANKVSLIQHLLMLNCPAGIQLLLCFCAAALSLKFMLVQMAPEVYFWSCVVHQSQICAKLHFLSQFLFLMCCIFLFLLL